MYKIIVSQTDKKIFVIFEHGKIVDKYAIDKAEDFLAYVDKFLMKYYTIKDSGFSAQGGPASGWKNVKLEFHNTGILTERVIRAIMLGFCF